MSAQGLRHAAEPATLDNKPGERRRGAAGRAAALRRAPSDSDCSGETASLSADSGERRPAPPPPRSGKTRSRRRGSEWEVLEGLKDGQRFERRPDVFNGYLHKKRKWPLKGWHKRFFVVDGGILVYARSPADVARGRLHGSLDVGLSVISAKPRRRRIDIDADEFIYHLRAKTPDAFRTWLNVLKAHRLYRQHLLTFGARESVPKIHAPLEELPPAETASRCKSSLKSFSTMTAALSLPDPKLTGSPTFCLPPSDIESSVYEKTCNDLIKDWKEKESDALLPLKLESVVVTQFEGKSKNSAKPGSFYSMCCIGKKVQESLKPGTSSPGDMEKQVHCTDLDLRVIRSPVAQLNYLQNSSLLNECTLDSDTKNSIIHVKPETGQCGLSLKEKPRVVFDGKPQTAMFFTARKKNSTLEDQWVMRRSKKSTNLFKYRNSMVEPPLKRPFSKCLLLGRYKINMPSLTLGAEKTANRSILCDIMPCGDAPAQEDKSVQDTLTSSEYDNITERIILTLFKHKEKNIYKKDKTNVRFYVNEAVKQLYNVELPRSQANPIQYLFKYLLEFWLKNTESEILKDSLKRSKSVARQSNGRFTKDAQLSSDFIKSASKGTQVFETSTEIIDWENSRRKRHITALKQYNEQRTKSPVELLPKATTESEKDRRIQELERVLKNTVYVCEVRSNKSKEKDIKITKKLIHNLDRLSKRSVIRDGSDENREISDPSAEIPKIQETLHHLISDTDLPPEIAKEFLSVYLDVLIDSDSVTGSSTSRSSETPIVFQSIGDGQPIGDVQTESVQKNVSKCVTTATHDKVAKPSLVDDQCNSQNVDPGQMYLKDILDKITSIFSRVRKIDPKAQPDVKDAEDDETEAKPGTDLGKITDKCNNHDSIYENKEDESVMIDLAKYALRNISMVNEATSTGLMSITIKLKEKPADFGEYKRKNLSLKFSKEHPQAMQVNTAPNRHLNSFIELNNPTICRDHTFPTNKLELKPFLSSSDATSKANRHLHESDSLNFSFRSNASAPGQTPSQKSLSVADDAQCYLLSTFKKGIPEVHDPDRKKIRLKELNDVLKSRVVWPELLKHQDEGAAFEKPLPRIIDETFILLLLENVALLSKNLPGIHKDINNLYLKLRKRHEKVTKHSSFSPGLGLLGKIYNSESGTHLHKLAKDVETQYEPIMPGNECTAEEAVEIPVKTSLLPSPELLDVTRNTRKLSNTLEHLEVQKETTTKTKQTTKEHYFVKKSEGSSIEVQTSSLNLRTLKCEAKQTTERSVSIQNCYKKLRQECSITAIKCVSDKDDAPNMLRDQNALKMKTHTAIVAPKITQKRHSSKMRKELIKGVSLLPPSLKVSTEAQTYRKNVRHLKCLEDIKVLSSFPVSKGSVARSTVTGARVAGDCSQSDELRTLYRCSSVPSYCSDRFVL